MNRRNFFALCLYLLGILSAVLPPAIAILTYFPIWASRGASSVASGFTLLLLSVAAVPLFKAAKKLLESPSAPVMWLTLFLLFLMLSEIAHDMTVISFVGFIGNLIGAAFFKLSGRMKKTVKTDE